MNQAAHDKHGYGSNWESQKHGNTLIGALRKLYGRNFAPGCDDNERLGDCLHLLDERSLSQLVKDQRV